MSENYYQIIEEKFGFSIPIAYRKMEQRGFMQLEQPVHYSAMTVPGEGYLWMNDMEWYSPRKIAEFEFEDYHLPGFVPFAFTGGGDYWCWQPAEHTEKGVRVLLCHHDSQTATIYAPDFASALYRQILEFACYRVDDLAVARAIMNRWAVDLVNILPEAWIARIILLKDRDLESSVDECGFQCLGLVSLNEVKRIESEDIAYPLQDEEVQWMVPFQ